LLGRQTLSIEPGGTLQLRPFDDDIPEHGILVFRTRGQPARTPTLWEQWLIRAGLGSWVSRGSDPYVFVDLRAGKETVRFEPGAGTEFRIAPDGKRFGLRTDRNRVEIWDMPPRKPWNQVAVGAAATAVPIVLLARRRVRSMNAA
jgi:hypothetical protein